MCAELHASGIEHLPVGLANLSPYVVSTAQLTVTILGAQAIPNLNNRHARK